MDPLQLASLIGHGVGTAALTIIVGLWQREREHHRRSDRKLHNVASAVDQVKDEVCALGAVDAAALLRSLTRRVTANMVRDSLHNEFESDLHAAGLNTEHKLRKTRRLVKPVDEEDEGDA